MATKRDLPADSENRDIAEQGTRGFALSPGETAEEFLAEREDMLRSAGVEPRWPGAAEIRRKIDAGELGS
jgi:hypothetical protein